MTTKEIVDKFIERVQRTFPLDLDEATDQDAMERFQTILDEIRGEQRYCKEMREYYARDWVEQSNW